jgi:hypothetical protein
MAWRGVALRGMAWHGVTWSRLSIHTSIAALCLRRMRMRVLQVGGNFPLYGCCWYVREMLHRPPYLARQEYRSCRAPFRQCMIAAPRCYCLLSHYPFFDLHFRVGGVAAGLAWQPFYAAAPAPVLTEQAWA